MLALMSGGKGTTDEYIGPVDVLFERFPYPSVSKGKNKGNSTDRNTKSNNEADAAGGGERRIAYDFIEVGTSDFT